MYLYSINIDLHTSNYHIRVIDIRSYIKDSYHTTSHSQATLLVGVQPATLTATPKSNLSSLTILTSAIVHGFTLM